MISAIKDEKIQKILWAPGTRGEEWKSDLERFKKGDVTLTRKSAGELSIKAVQRLLFFLGYSTSSTGAFAIDGDFGRGTNRAVAQFRFEHGMTRQDFRKTLCYKCNWQNARSNITTIPDVRLTVKTLKTMLDRTKRAIANNEVMCGSFNEAVYHLNNVHKRALLNCRKILKRYGTLVDRAVTGLANQRNINVRPEWVLSIMRQETGGVVRPRFEQHLLTRYDRKKPGVEFEELRYRSMSFGLM